MGSWRKQKGEIHHQDVQGTRSFNRKPPQASWQPTVPSWEKKFCTSVGSIPWRKLLEAKRFIYLYENVVQWNDSAGEEAFHNAKNRFWAEINGLPCDISLPDPDIYIDEIDWNSDIDPELLLDLEREPDVPDETDKDENVVTLGNSLLLNQSFLCTGWGDAEEDFQKGTENFNDDKNPWECSYVPNNGDMKDNGWGNCWNDSSEWNQWEKNNDWDNNCNEFNKLNQWENNNNNNNAWDNNHNELNNVDDRRTGGDWGTWDGNGRKKEGNGWHMSRYKTSRFHGDDHPVDRGWWNEKGRKKEGTGWHRLAHVKV